MNRVVGTLIGAAVATACAAVITFDRREHALTAGFWRCVEILAGVGIGLALTAIPFPGE